MDLRDAGRRDTHHNAACVMQALSVADPPSRYLCVYNTQLYTGMHTCTQHSEACMSCASLDMHEHLAGAHSIVGTHGH